MPKIQINRIALHHFPILNARKPMAIKPICRPQSFILDALSAHTRYGGFRVFPSHLSVHAASTDRWLDALQDASSVHRASILSLHAFSVHRTCAINKSQYMYMYIRSYDADERSHACILVLSMRRPARCVYFSSENERRGLQVVIGRLGYIYV